MVRALLKCGIAAAALIAAAPAAAAWHEASTRHFVIYADDSPKRLQAFAERLERFDAAVRSVDHLPDPVIGPGNRLTVFVLPKASDVQALVGDKTGFLDGFYTGRLEGSLAYVARDAPTYGENSKATIFFHEYTHHLMMQDFDRPYPEWFVEGFAEFFSTPEFERDGSVWFGVPAQHRAWGLFNGPQLRVDALFQGMTPKMTIEQREVFYGRAWLLTHYLFLGKKRNGQLATYVKLLSSGSAPLSAAQQAFGDLRTLDAELNKYMTGSMIKFKIDASKIRIGPISVTPLSAGAAAVILTRAKVKYRKNQPAELLVSQVRGIAQQFPNDELVIRTLAEAELNAGRPKAAEEAADRALKANPQSAEAMVLKGKALLEEAGAATDAASATQMFAAARRSFIAANKLDSEDPEPLYEFYHAFIAEGEAPSTNALAALHYASDLAPQDLGVRMNSALAYINEGKFKEARAALAVVAYSPHAGSAGEAAKRLIAGIDSGKGKATLLELRRSSDRDDPGE